MSGAREGKDDDGSELESLEGLGTGEDPDVGDPPPLIADGYNQTYVVRSVAGNSSDANVVREVMFRCGNWCYSGEVSFAGLGGGITLKDVPRVIPMLQRQQGRLRFYCCASSVPPVSPYFYPLRLLADAQEFVASELSSERTVNQLESWSRIYPWIDAEPAKGGSGSTSVTNTYFEMKASMGDLMRGVTLVASKTYARGLVFITVYFEGSFYVVMLDGEGDQALLDIRFPDLSAHGQGLLMQSYYDESLPWRKLTLWHSLASAGVIPATTSSLRPCDVRSLSSTSYVQTYVVMAPNQGGDPTVNAKYRDVLFRFGSWCYGGTVQLTPCLSLADIPHVIPALRMQQGRLDFVFDVAAVPTRSPFARPLEYLAHVMPIMEQEIVASERVLTELLETLANMGLADSISMWFEGDALQSFFEFTMQSEDGGGDESGGGADNSSPGRRGNDREPSLEHTFRGVDLVASKCYTPQGVVLITIWFQGTFYVVLGDGGEEQPLLDSRFPDVSLKGRGYQIRSAGNGREDWRELRKVSIWQTAAGLQREMEARLAKDEGAKSSSGNDGAKASIGKAPAAGGGTLGGSFGRSALGGDPRAEPKGANLLDTFADTTAGEGKSSLDRAMSPIRGAKAVSGPSVGSLGVGPTSPLDSRLKLGENRASAGGGDSEKGGPSSPTSAVTQAPERMAAAKPLTKTRVALPHHIAPLGAVASSDLDVKLKKMREELGSDMGEAPWDEFGRPRAALGAKSHK